MRFGTGKAAGDAADAGIDPFADAQGQLYTSPGLKARGVESLTILPVESKIND
jgi:hypothetical protein